MGLSCIYKNECCFGAYTRCFRVRRFFRRKNKTSPDSISRSPQPSIKLTTAGKEEDEQSIHDQLSLFHFGAKNGSGRRFSHPNQVKYVEEYERLKGMSGPGSPCSSIHPENEEFDYDEEHVNKFLNDGKNDVDGGRKSPTSPVLDNPVVPPSTVIG